MQEPIARIYTHLKAIRSRRRFCKGCTSNREIRRTSPNICENVDFTTTEKKVKPPPRSRPATIKIIQRSSVLLHLCAFGARRRLMHQVVISRSFRMISRSSVSSASRQLASPQWVTAPQFVTDPSTARGYSSASEATEPASTEAADGGPQPASNVIKTPTLSSDLSEQDVMNQSWKRVKHFIKSAKIKRKASLIWYYNKRVYEVPTRYEFWRLMGLNHPPRKALFSHATDVKQWVGNSRALPPTDKEEEEEMMGRDADVERKMAEFQEKQKEKEVEAEDDGLVPMEEFDYSKLEKYGPISTKGLDDEAKARLSERLRQEEMRFYSSSLWSLGVILRYYGARIPPPFDVEAVSRDPFVFASIRETYSQEWNLFKYHAARSGMYVRKQEEINAAFKEMNNFHTFRHTKAKAK
eukprot:g39380.t1